MSGKGFTTAHELLDKRRDTHLSWIARGAGWSSPVARQAHNLKVVSSNLAPATVVTETLGSVP